MNDTKSTKTAAKGNQLSEHSNEGGSEHCKEGNSDSEAHIRGLGDVISPEVADGMVEKIVEEIYGLKVVSYTRLNGYEDRNFHIQVSPSESWNPHVTSLCPDGYVLRVVNTMDTSRPEYLRTQLELIRHLRDHGITAQEAIRSLTGDLVAFYQFPPPSGQGDVITHALYLRTFISGKLLCDVTLTHDLCFKVGEFMGSMTKVFETFQYPFPKTFDVVWNMTYIPKVAEYAHVITDAKDRRVVDDVIAQFSSCVLPRRHEIRSGIIHGDPFAMNILVQRKATSSPDSASSSAADNPDEYVISGIIDFQEIALSHPLYDLGMLIAYTSLTAQTFDPLEVGGHILAGYTSVLELPEIEESLMRFCVAGRLVQSLVLGAYNYSLNPTNGYLLDTARRGWHVLHALWDTPPDKLNGMWTDIQQSYKRDSSE